MTTMTRQHFNFIADTLKEALDEAHNAKGDSLEVETAVWAATRVAHRFAKALKATNPGFKPDRFLRACGLDD